MYYPSNGGITEPVELEDDLTITDSTKGLVLTSPDNSKFRVKADNDGILETEEVV